MYSETDVVLQEKTTTKVIFVVEIDRGTAVCGHAAKLNHAAIESFSAPRKLPTNPHTAMPQKEKREFLLPPASSLDVRQTGAHTEGQIC